MINKTFNFIYGKIVPLALAWLMLCEVSSPASAQYVAVRDNTRVANNVSAALARAYKKSNPSDGLLSFEQAKSIFAREDKQSKLTPQDYAALYGRYIKSVSAADVQVAAAYNSLKKEINLDGDLSYIYRKAGKSGKFCEGKKCFALNNYVQGFLRARLYDGAGLSAGTAAKFRWNSEIMLSAMPDIYWAVTNNGVNHADVAFLQKYLRFTVSKASDYCDNASYLADYAPGLAGADGRGKAVRGKEIRRQQCQNIGKAMVLLGLSVQSGKDKLEDSRLIYNVTKNTYKDDYGAITLSSGVAALIAIGTKGSYAYIDKILTEDTVRASHNFGNFKNGFNWFMDLLSVQSWIEKSTDVNNRLRGRGGRYLNPVSAMFQYLDEDYARASGVSDFSVSVARDNPSLGYNVPYGNVFEDLGVMISSTHTVQGRQIAQKIVNTYAAAVKKDGNAGRDIHTPLVLGVLETGLLKNSSAQYAASKMNSLDWWDLNEATQRRVNNLAAVYPGTVKRGISQAKIKRNERNQKIIQAGVWTDMMVSAFFVMSMVAELPSIVRSAATLTRNVGRIRAINEAGKADLLRFTRARIAQAPVKPAQIKAILAAREVPLRKINANIVKSVPRVKNTPKAEVKFHGQIQYTLLAKDAPVPHLSKYSVAVGEGGSSGAAAAKTVAKVSETPKKLVVSVPEAKAAKPLKPYVSDVRYASGKYALNTAAQRKVLYNNRNFAQKIIFGDKFYGEMTPFKQRLSEIGVAGGLQINFLKDFANYGLKDPKFYLSFALPGANIIQTSASVPQEISRTIKVVPAVLKGEVPFGTFKISDNIALAKKAPLLPDASKAYYMTPIEAVTPKERLVTSIPKTSKVNAGASIIAASAATKKISEGPLVLNKKKAFAQIKQKFGAKSNEEAFAAMAQNFERQHPDLLSSEYVYRGMFVSKENEVKEITSKGMDISRVVSKPLPISPQEASFEIRCERSNICFAPTPNGAMSYASGVNMFNRGRKGYMTLVVAQKPADLNTKGIWYLERSMRADEIKAVLVYDVERGQWLEFK